MTFESKNGKRVRFCWGELMLAGDAWPVTLAYSRVPVIPPVEKEKPGFKAPKEMLSGFRLIAPRDPDTGRYLEDVVRVTYGQVRLPVGLLPERKKRMKCESRDLVCVRKTTALGIGMGGPRTGDDSKLATGVSRKGLHGSRDGLWPSSQGLPREELR